MLAGYPDYGKAPPLYLIAIIEFVALLRPDEQAALIHPRTGIATRCPFLPSIADLSKMVDEYNHEKDMWEKRIVYARQRRQWSSTKWGPFPGQPDCRVPAYLLQPGDGDGWTEWSYTS